jgi:hypothetical protein
MKTTGYFFTLLFLSVMLINISAQNLPQIQVSPHAKVLQEVGLSEITIDYHRPAVKGREVWGKLVPYGMTNLGFGTAKESPWRAGANENTVITFTDEVKINGNMLPAGSYGLHIIVTENEWTIIFSKTNTAWGSFFYDPKDDALRITVTPEKCELNEWLLYGFENLSAASADVFLKWENIKVKFTAAFDVNDIVLERYRKTLVGAAGFRAPNFQQAAAFCVANNINLEEAEVWINHALSLQETGMSLLIKAQLLEKKSNKSEATELEKKAFTIATEVELNTYGYNLMLQEKNIEKAIEVFKLNVEKFPSSWNVYDSLAEAYGTKGDKENSVKYYKLALDKAPENQHARIQKAIESMK